MMQGGLSCKVGHPVIKLNEPPRKKKKKMHRLFFDRSEQQPTGLAVKIYVEKKLAMHLWSVKKMFYIAKAAFWNN